MKLSALLQRLYKIERISDKALAVDSVRVLEITRDIIEKHAEKGYFKTHVMRCDTYALFHMANYTNLGDYE